MATKQNLRAVGDRIEQLLEELRAAADPRIYGQAEELLSLVTDLYGGGLARIVEIAQQSDDKFLRQMLDDELVGSLLLVHGLSPDDLTTRVERALEKVRPMLAGHNGNVELLDVDAEAGAVHLKLLGSCNGCSSSTVTLRLAVEAAIVDMAPEIVTIDVDLPEEDAPDADGSVPISLGAKKKQTYDECPAELIDQ